MLDRGQYRAVVLSVLMVSPAAPVAAQECSGVRTSRALAIAAGWTAVEAGALALQQDTWWEGRPRSFHAFWGRSNSAGQDALLHGAISYQLARVSIAAWDWACASPVQAAWLGAATAFAAGLPKEIGDGIHANGFSGTDLTFAAFGVALPALHRTWPVTRIAAVKVWYWPSHEYRTRAPGALPSLQNDYAGQRFYVSLNPARGFDGAGPWPDWLGVGIGHSTPTWASVPPSHEWYISLDVDFRALPVHTTWWPRVAAVLDQIHMPAPGLRFTLNGTDAGVF